MVHQGLKILIRGGTIVWIEGAMNTLEIVRKLFNPGWHIMETGGVAHWRHLQPIAEQPQTFGDRYAMVWKVCSNRRPELFELMPVALPDENGVEMVVGLIRLHPGIDESAYQALLGVGFVEYQFAELMG